MMKRKRATLLVMLAPTALFSLSLFFMDILDIWLELTTLLFLLACVLLHSCVVAPGKAHWLSFPAGWVACLLPNYISSYHIEKPGFFGHGFAFGILTVLVLAPSFLLSLILAVIRRIRLYRARNKPLETR